VSSGNADKKERTSHLSLSFVHSKPFLDIKILCVNKSFLNQIIILNNNNIALYEYPNNKEVTKHELNSYFY